MMMRARLRVRAEFSPLERALNYPKSRPAGGGFAPCRRMCRPVPWVGLWAEHLGDGGVAQLVRAAES